MAIIPTEVLRIIFGSDILQKDIGTLRSVRLANHSFCEIATEYLFKCIVLYYTEASYNKMMAVARHRTYHTHVRCIGISPQAIPGADRPGAFLNRDEFGQWFRQERLLMQRPGLKKGFFKVPPEKEHLPYREAAVIDLHHAAYKSLCAKQEQLSGKAGKMLETAIASFYRLEKVDTTNVETPPTPYPVPSTDNASIRDLWQDNARMNDYSHRHKKMIMEAVSEGRFTVTSRYEVGTLVLKMDTATIKPPTNSRIISCGNIVLDVSFFCILLSGHHLGRGTCERFTGKMQRLESLTCTTSQLHHPLSEEITISSILGNNTWQRLNRLDLGGLYTDASYLDGLFSRHKSTLEHLGLHSIFLRSGSWRAIFSTLRACSLRSIKVNHLGSGDQYPEIRENCFFFPFPSSPPPAPLYAFLFQEGPWVAEMEDLLERSA